MKSKFDIAYFSAEIGISRSLPTYSGGLGILAGDHIKSAADLGLNMCGITLLYKEGYFKQRIDEEGILTVGISEHAQDLLGDIVFVELPDIGMELDAEEESAIVESVKAASDVYAPLSGEVIEVNEKLLDEPEIVNSSPLEDGWFFKIKLNDASSFENLMTEEEYNATCEE